LRPEFPEDSFNSGCYKKSFEILFRATFLSFVEERLFLLINISNLLYEVMRIITDIWLLNT
jgi:hypothetical protein